jgi:hypothetical protein
MVARRSNRVMTFAGNLLWPQWLLIGPRAVSEARGIARVTPLPPALSKVAKLVFEGFSAMAKKPAEQIAEDTAEALTKRGEAAEKIVKGNAEALTESGNASRAAIQELTRAYQELATKNAKNLTAAMQALAAVKSPTEFIQLQQRLIKEGVEAAISDSQHIAQLTTTVFTAAFEPVKKQIEALQKTART